MATTRNTDSNSPPPSFHEAKVKTARYCGYQERTQQQVRDKLFSLGLPSDEVEKILSELIAEGYVNEERFARQYAGGKFRIKKWGRVKIIQGLKGKGLTSLCIERGLQEIEEADYLHALKTIALKKYESIQGEDKLIKRLKTFNFLKSRGYEYDLINNVLDEI